MTYFYRVGGHGTLGHLDLLLPPDISNPRYTQPPKHTHPPLDIPPSGHTHPYLDIPTLARTYEPWPGHTNSHPDISTPCPHIDLPNLLRYPSLKHTHPSRHTEILTLMWTEWLTDACENITFPQLFLRAVINHTDSFNNISNFRIVIKAQKIYVCIHNICHRWRFGHCIC